MFNKNFYPTPQELSKRMLDKLTVKYSKSIKILEPSAGKGDLVKAILENEAFERQKVSIDMLEIDSNLQLILQGLPYQEENKHLFEYDNCSVGLVGGDFLNYNPFINYDYIIANPPFDKGDEHLLKMINIAENQTSRCEILCLLNAETIRNPYSNKRKELISKLASLQADFEYIENSFIGAERKTNVEVVIVHLTVYPNLAYNSYYEEFFNKLKSELENKEYSDNQVH